MAASRRGASDLKRLIVTADDFGASTLVNEAVEQAHRAGILTTTCLMVAGAAAEDAVWRAKRLPKLRVGLHVVVVDGPPTLAPDVIPSLVGRDGQLPKRLVSSGFRFFFSPAARRQLEAEIRAQFEAFAKTGLTLDHVNGHNHMHLHPTVLAIMMRVGRDYGMRAMRLPFEPFGPSWRAVHRDVGLRFANSVLLAPVLGAMRARLRRGGVVTNDFVFGLSDTGHMTPERVLALVRELPDGVTEMYSHPATRPWPGMPAGSQCQEELAALMDPAISACLRESGVALTTFGALAGQAA